MSKQKIEIEVDVPDGWEFDGYRVPAIGDVLLLGDGSRYVVTADWRDTKAVILRKLPAKPTFPDWFPSGWWIGRDEDGKWYGYSMKPSTYSEEWAATETYDSYLPLRDMSTFANLPDASVPWKKCCYQCVRSEE